MALEDDTLQPPHAGGLWHRPTHIQTYLKNIERDTISLRYDFPTNFQERRGKREESNRSGTELIPLLSHLTNT